MCLSFVVHFSDEYQLYSEDRDGSGLDGCAWSAATIEPDKPHMCRKCGKRYTHQFTLNRHQRNVCGKKRTSIGNWRCRRCSRSYASEGSLARHIKFECGVHRKFLCVLCSHKFTQKSSLLRHMRHFHNDHNFENNESTASSEKIAMQSQPPDL